MTIPRSPPPTTTWTPTPHAPAPAVSKPLPAGSYWLWSESAPGYEAYKNETLRRFQDAMSSCGIPRTDQRLFVQQVTQENGALDPSMTGGTDRGYSFGIGQWNTSPVRAATHLARFPEHATLDWQISELAKSSCEKYALYPGDIRRAIVTHNCPACARSNAKPSRCSSVDSLRKISGRWSCYFDDEVDGTAARTRIVQSS